MTAWRVPRQLGSCPRQPRKDPQEVHCAQLPASPGQSAAQHDRTDALRNTCPALPQTIISTPTKNYTVLEQKQLLLDMGDVGGVSGAAAGLASAIGHCHWQCPDAVPHLSNTVLLQGAPLIQGLYRDVGASLRLMAAAHPAVLSHPTACLPPAVVCSGVSAG